MSRTSSRTDPDAFQIWHYELPVLSSIVEAGLRRDGAFFQQIVRPSGDPARTP